MILKTKYGTEIDTDKIGNSFGDFGKYMRCNVDKEWGMNKQREITHTKKYRIVLSGYASVSAVVYVEAEDEEEARTLALKDKFSTTNWDLDCYDDIDNVEVYDIEEETEE